MSGKRLLTTSDRVRGKRNSAISSLTTVDTAVSMTMAFFIRLALILAGMDSPAERITKDMESITIPCISREAHARNAHSYLPAGSAKKLGIVRPA